MRDSKNSEKLLKNNEQKNGIQSVRHRNIAHIETHPEPVLLEAIYSNLRNQIYIYVILERAIYV